MDYQKLNAITKLDAYPLLRIDSRPAKTDSISCRSHYIGITTNSNRPSEVQNAVFSTEHATAVWKAHSLGYGIAGA